MHYDWIYGDEVLRQRAEKTYMVSASVLNKIFFYLCAVVHKALTVRLPVEHCTWIATSCKWLKKAHWTKNINRFWQVQFFLQVIFYPNHHFLSSIKEKIMLDKSFRFTYILIFYTANVYRDLQGLCREIGVLGFQIYGDCMYTHNPCKFR